MTVYFGPGVVRSNHNGVDLSEFSHVDLPISDPERLNFKEANHWLTRTFSLDPALFAVTIQAVFTKSCTDIKWDLLPIESTGDWRSWLRVCNARKSPPVALVQAIMKGGGSAGGGYEAEQNNQQPQVETPQVDEVVDSGWQAGQSSEPVERVPTGQADEEEEFESMQEVMEQEDEDGMAEDVDEDSGDEDNIHASPIPSAWNQELLGGMSVNDDHDSGWEYNKNQIQIGSMYATKKELKHAVTQWAMSTQRIFRTDISSQTI